MPFSGGGGITLDDVTLNTNGSGQAQVDPTYANSLGGGAPANYLGTKTSDPASPTVGQWWYRSDLGMYKMYTGPTYGSVVTGGAPYVVSANTTLAAGTYGVIMVLSGVTLTLTAAATYNFQDILNFGTVASGGCTQNYNGPFGFIAYSGSSYTTTGSDTISGYMQGTAFGASIAVASATTLTLQNIIMNGQVTGAGTLEIPVGTTVVYSQTTAMGWSPGAFTFNGILYITNTATGRNLLTTTTTIGTYARLICDASLSWNDTNAIAGGTAFTTTVNAPIETSVYGLTSLTIGKNISGIGVVAISHQNTIPAGTNSYNFTNFNKAGTSVGVLSGTAHPTTFHLTSITTSNTYNGWHYEEFSRNSTTTVGWSSALYIGSSGTITCDVVYGDNVNNTIGTTNIALIGDIAYSGFASYYNSTSGGVDSNNGSPATFTITGTLYG